MTRLARVRGCLLLRLCSPKLTSPGPRLNSGCALCRVSVRCRFVCAARPVPAASFPGSSFLTQFSAPVRGPANRDGHASRSSRVRRRAIRKTIHDQFRRLGLAAPSSRRCDQGSTTAPPRSRPRRSRTCSRAATCRHRPDRHRQDRGLRAADPAPARRRPAAGPARGAAACSCSPRPASSRARSPRASATYGRHIGAHSPSCSAASATAAVAGAGARRRRAGRDARPPARPSRAARVDALGASRSWCSTRPTRCSISASSTPIRRIVAHAAGEAADAVLLGDHADARSGSSPTNCCAIRSQVAVAPAGDHGRPRRAARRVRRDAEQARAAGRAARATRRCSACSSSPAPSTAPTAW